MKRTKNGRQNSYSLILDKEFRHTLEADHTIGDVLRILAEE